MRRLAEAWSAPPPPPPPPPWEATPTLGFAGLGPPCSRWRPENCRVVVPACSAASSQRKMTSRRHLLDVEVTSGGGLTLSGKQTDSGPIFFFFWVLFDVFPKTSVDFHHPDFPIRDVQMNPHSLGGRKHVHPPRLRNKRMGVPECERGRTRGLGGLQKTCRLCPLPPWTLSPEPERLGEV